MELIVLGSSSAIPAHNRGLSAQVLACSDRNYLIDCGEGTQFRLISNRVRLSRIHQIFISHLHGDHVYGLPGLLGTMSMQGRKAPLDLFAPQGLSEMIWTVLDGSGTRLGFPLNLHRVDTGIYAKVFSDDHFRVYSVPLEHRVPVCGYKFVQRESRNIKPEIIRTYRLDFDQIRAIKSGKDIVLASGQRLKSKDHTWIKQRPMSFAYLSDTVIYPAVLPYIQGVDILFHEATYLDELRELAWERKHTTARQAARLAAAAGAGKLVIGHFSSRYKNLQPLLDEARSEFPESYLGLDGSRFPF
jgi:ribonuclease Z